MSPSAPFPSPTPMPRDMIEEIKGYALLRGYRGISADIEALEKLLMTISDFVMKNPDISEMDLNPVFLYPDGYMVVDARIILGEPRPIAPGCRQAGPARPLLSQEHCRHWSLRHAGKAGLERLYQSRQPQIQG